MSKERTYSITCSPAQFDTLKALEKGMGIDRTILFVALAGIVMENDKTLMTKLGDKIVEAQTKAIAEKLGNGGFTFNIETSEDDSEESKPPPTAKLSDKPKPTDKK